MNRNIAFFITNAKKNDLFRNKAKLHLTSLASEHEFEYEELNFGDYIVSFVSSGDASYLLNDESLVFSIGNLGDNKLENDRFLKIELEKSNVIIENDYAGTIPVFYSNLDSVVISNIEPAVVLATNTKEKDVSYENLYGYLKYVHFIWDETAYNHIRVMEPDSLYSFSSANEVIKKYLETVKCSDENLYLSNEEVAFKLYELNNKLVINALENYDQIILPLSSGYDSRMILAALSTRPDLKEKVFCFTYGSLGAIEVEAARRLTKSLGIKWKYIDLPMEFLRKEYLSQIDSIFGASLHMHGMYQIEFYKELSKHITISPNACLTSGFMTGVPAGQHNSLLSIDNAGKLTDAMNKFSQSKCWSNSDLNKLPPFQDKNYLDTAEERFGKAFSRFSGRLDQKAVMFDVWTRQRSFVSYYPRTLEWLIPTVSPHMNSEYVSFFMSLSKHHLDDRYAVELMFKHCYPELSKIVSNSNGIKAIDGVFENIMFRSSKILKKLKLSSLLPQKYRDNSFEFDLPALRDAGEEGVFPLMSKNKKVDDFINKLIDIKGIDTLYKKAVGGDTDAYQKLAVLQSLAFAARRFSDEY